MEICFVVKGGGAVMLRFRFEYKTSVICHNVNTQNVKITRRDRRHIRLSFTPVWNIWKPFTYWHCSSEETSFREFALKTFIFISIGKVTLIKHGISFRDTFTLKYRKTNFLTNLKSKIKTKIIKMKRKHLLFKEAVCKNRKSLIKLFVNRNLCLLIFP